MTGSSINIKREIVKIVEGLWRRWLFRAIVTGTDGNRVLIRRQGQSSADTQAYAKLESYTTPSVADEVLVIWAGGFLVIGRIIR